MQSRESFSFSITSVAISYTHLEGDIFEHAEAAAEKYPDSVVKIMARGTSGSDIRPGWNDFDAGVDAACDSLERLSLIHISLY